MRVSLEEALDDCLQRLDTEGLAGCQARYPEHWPALEPLLTVAVRLQAATPPAMPAAARAAWKERLTVARPPTAAPVPPRRVLRPLSARLSAWWPRIGGWRAAVALVVVLALLAGTWSAASASLPGDPLYGARLTQEEVGLWFVSGSADLAGAHFGLADRRTDEVEVLAAQSRLAAAPLALSNFHDHLVRGLAAFALSLPAQRTTLATELKKVSDRAVTAFNTVTSEIREDSVLSASILPLVQPALALAQQAQEQAAQPQTILTPRPLTTPAPTGVTDGAGSPTAALSPTAAASPTILLSPTGVATPTATVAVTLTTPSETATAVVAGTAFVADTPSMTPSAVAVSPTESPTALSTVPPLSATVIAPVTPTATSRPVSSPVRTASPTPLPKPSATRTPRPTTPTQVPPTPTPVPPAPTRLPSVTPTATLLPPPLLTVAPTEPPPPTVEEPTPTTVVIVPPPEPPLVPTATPEVNNGDDDDNGGGNGNGNNGNGNGNGGGNGSNGGGNGNGNGNGGGNGNGNNGNGNGNGGPRTPTP